MDWTALRGEFPVTTRWAYFDHAAVAPISGRAHRALAEWADDQVHNGVVHEPRWLGRIEQTRQDFGRLLHCDPLDLAFVKNTTEGIAFVAEGFPWRPGDNVVTAEEEYPSNLYPWLNLQSRGVEVRRVPSRGSRVLVDDLRAAMDGRTRLLSLSFVEFASGFRNDLDAVGNLCRERGVAFFVDAIQGLGVLPLDVERTPIDFLSADGHKWLLGPEGAGIFYVRRDMVEKLRPIEVGWNSVAGAWDFSKIDLTLKPHAGRWECGSYNTGGIVALGASLGQLLEIGIDAVAERILKLTDHLCERAAAAGLEVFSSRRPGEASAIVSIVPPGDGKQIVRHCKAEGVILSLRAGRLRVSPHCYNTTEEIDRLVDLVREGPP